MKARRHLTFLAALAAAAALPGCVFAWNTGGDSLQKRVDRLEGRIQELEKSPGQEQVVYQFKSGEEVGPCEECIIGEDFVLESDPE